MKFEDDGEVDDKVVVVPDYNRDQGDWMTSINDEPALKAKLEHHFTHYKDLKKPGSTVVERFADIDEAKQVVAEAIERWNNQ